MPPGTFRAPTAVFSLVRTLITCGLALVLAQAFAQNANRAVNSHHGPSVGADAALQKQALPLLGATIDLNFAGIPEGDQAYPDANLAVGPSYIVQVANSSFAVYSKAGIIYRNFPMQFKDFFPKTCQTQNGVGGFRFFSPIVLYDRQADRWLLAVVNAGTESIPPYTECVAISKTNDPTGGYFFYSLQPQLPQLGETFKYTKVSVWPTSSNSAYLFTFNVYTAHNSATVGAAICALDRTSAMQGNPISLLCPKTPNGPMYLTPPDDYAYLPSDNDGPTSPPDRTPGLFLSWHYSTNQLYLRTLTPDFANGRVTLSSPTAISVPAANVACGLQSDGTACIPQPGTAQQLNAAGDRLMYRFPVRHFPDHDRAVVTHAILQTSNVAFRWYEIYDPAGAVSINQYGTFSPDSTNRWMGSMAEDKNGDIAIGYSVSSSTIYPSIYFTGRIPSDPAGTLESEASILVGSTSKTDNGLWGTYTALQVDPVDDCTFWYTNQYVQNNGSNQWATEIASFKFQGCP